ncbi:MAG: zinc-binding dehydrogenase [Candidatus Omnitrophota bacterium]
MMKTKVAVLCQVNEPLRIEELTLPELKPGQVLVKIAYSGICHSQLNEINGLKGEDKFLPHTLGHEGSGVVEAVGAGVKKVKKGDRVVLTWIKSSGCDVPSVRYGRRDGSFVNSGAISTFLTKAVISENRVVKISDEMPLKEAALLGCAVPTGAGIVMNTLKVCSGDSIAVFGIGGIGLSALLAAKFAGASIIIAVDISDNKLEQSLKFGSTHTINAKDKSAVSEIMEITSGIGVDYAIEAAGKKESMENAFQSVRDNGGLCIVAGNLPQGERISINPFDLIKGKRIVGTWGGETHPDMDIPEYVKLYLSGKFDFGKMITHIVKLENVNEAFDLLKSDKTGRVLIEL